MGTEISTRLRRLLQAGCLIGVLAGQLATPSPADVGLYDSEGQSLPFETYDEVREFLATAELGAREKIPVGTNPKKRKVLLEKNGISVHAIHRTMFKILDTPGGGFVDSYLSELAAYELARLLNLDNVPPVVRRKGGSLQIWIENGMSDAERLRSGDEPVDPVVYELWLKDMHVFDNLIANLDRNSGNIVVDDYGMSWWIDHSRSFAGQRELRHPERITGCSRSLWKRLRELTDAEIVEAVKPYARHFTDALIERRELLVLEIARRIERVGEESFLFDAPNPAIESRGEEPGRI